MKNINFRKMAFVFFIIYSVLLTGLVFVAVLAGPFKETAVLWMENRVTEESLRDAEQNIKDLMAERSRLLEMVKKLTSDADIQSATIAAIRKTADLADVNKSLSEANSLVEKLDGERTVLLTKIVELRNELQGMINAREPTEVKKVAPETSDLVRRLEQENADLQKTVRKLERKLKENG